MFDSHVWKFPPARTHARRECFSSYKLASVTHLRCPTRARCTPAILEFSHRRDVPIPEMCEAIAGRLASPKWMVALKAQLTLHMLLRDGGERLMRYFSTRSGLLPTANFNDTRGLDAVARSQFIRGYSAHLQRKSETYLKLGYEWNQASASSKRDVIKTLNGTEVRRAEPYPPCANMVSGPVC